MTERGTGASRTPSGAGVPPPSLRIQIGPHALQARLETERAPLTCQALLRILPLRARLIQARWSGEAGWIPLGDIRLGIDYENHTSYPAPGEMLLYPGGISEMEILVPYGATRFASKVGQLAGNHFATLLTSRATLEEIGRLILWAGAQNVVVDIERPPANAVPFDSPISSLPDRLPNS